MSGQYISDSLNIARFLRRLHAHYFGLISIDGSDACEPNLLSSGDENIYQYSLLINSS